MNRSDLLFPSTQNQIFIKQLLIAFLKNIYVGLLYKIRNNVANLFIYIESKSMYEVIFKMNISTTRASNKSKFENKEHPLIIPQCRFKIFSKDI